MTEWKISFRWLLKVKASSLWKDFAKSDVCFAMVWWCLTVVFRWKRLVTTKIKYAHLCIHPWIDWIFYIVWWMSRLLWHLHKGVNNMERFRILLFVVYWFHEFKLLWYLFGLYPYLISPTMHLVLPSCHDFDCQDYSFLLWSRKFLGFNIL